jgi:ferrous iron transport protein A
MEIKLSDLKPGQSGIIKTFENSELSLRFLEMGCVPGETISVNQVAPLGDPISVKVAGYILSLRLNEADFIIVDLEN